MLTLGYDPMGKQLKVAAVKNRFGPNSADGKDWVALDANYAACQINDVKIRTQQRWDSGGLYQ
jgi:hypothetical protein